MFPSDARESKAHRKDDAELIGIQGKTHRDEHGVGVQAETG
jgi:hypothetical protein